MRGCLVHGGADDRPDHEQNLIICGMKWLVFLLLSLFFIQAQAQDTAVRVEQKTIVMPMAVIRNNLNVAAFINYVKKDTSFYKAFKNLKVLGFTAINDVKMMDKKGNIKASLNSRTRQVRENGCRQTEIIKEEVTGDYYDGKRQPNYYTGEMYAGIMFVNGRVCGENNIVGANRPGTSGKKGMAKHKEQLKMLFFNPGQRIRGIPLMGDKTAIFDDDMAPYYDYRIENDEYMGLGCYKFSVTVKDSVRGTGKVVIDEMVTWFRDTDLKILGRTYALSYKAGVYDFDVEMEVRMTQFGQYQVPSLIRYKGNWDVVLKKRERGVFTATLFDFKE
jgi:hypothetical protein